MKTLLRLVRSFLIHLVGLVMIRDEPAVVSEPDDEWEEIKRTFFLGGERVPDRVAEGDILFSGGKGTGKTSMFKVLITSRIDGLISSGQPFNSFIYSPKPDDYYPILKERYEPLGISVRALNPFIIDAWAWDAAIDLTTLPKIDAMTVAVIKEKMNAGSGGDANEFFVKAAQLLLRGTVHALALTNAGTWTMRDVVLCLRDFRLTKQLLAKRRETRHLIALISDKQGVTSENLHATILAELKDLELVAALIQETPEDRRFSIIKAANQPNTIWVLGSDPRYHTVIEPLNGMQIELLSHELIIRGDIGIETCLFIDEFTQMNGGIKMSAIQKLLEIGRSSRVRTALAVQSPLQVLAVYGKEAGETILAQMHSFMAFMHSDEGGREYFAKRLGKERGWELKFNGSDQVQTTRNIGRGGGGGSVSRSTTHGFNQERFDLDRVSPSEFGDLPIGTYELGMKAYTSIPLSDDQDPTTPGLNHLQWYSYMSPEWIREHVPQPRKSYRRYSETLKPEEYYTLEPLQDWEYHRLGLVKPREGPARTKVPRKFRTSRFLDETPGDDSTDAATVTKTGDGPRNNDRTKKMPPKFEKRSGR